MTSGVTWDGEDAGRREGEAPRRTARSVGEWLDSLMSERARNEPHEATPARKGADLSEVEGRLDQVGRELDQLSRLNSTQTVLRPGLRDEAPSRDLDDAISRL